MLSNLYLGKDIIECGGGCSHVAICRPSRRGVGPAPGTTGVLLHQILRSPTYDNILTHAFFF